jgi:hypothetical protein
LRTDVAGRHAVLGWRCWTAGGTATVSEQPELRQGEMISMAIERREMQQRGWYVDNIVAGWCPLYLSLTAGTMERMCFDMVVIAVLEVCRAIAAADPLELCEWL